MNTIDWFIIIIYLGGLITVGFLQSSKIKNKEGFFLSNRSMPSWAVTISIVGTALSAGTFVGVPQVAFTGDMTFVMLLIGSTVGGILAAVFLVPILYSAGTLTIYGYLRNQIGPKTEIHATWFFLVGLLLSAGARHFIAAIVVSLMVFGSIDTPYLLTAIVALGVIATVYTAAGGIRAVIWSDVIQVAIFTVAAIMCVVLLFKLIPMDIGGIIEVLRNAPEGNKLRFWNAEFRFDQAYTVWAAVGAYSLLSFAQYGCDHDMVQRMLTCKSRWRASGSLIVSRFVQMPIVCLFLVIGALLYVFYLRPDVMGSAAPISISADTRDVFPHFILQQLPPGLLGIAIAGLLAASMSSFDSAVNAMASTIEANLKRQKSLTAETSSKEQLHEIFESRKTVVLMGAALTLFAVLAVFLQRAGGQNLVDFALGVLTFSYAGLFGVFTTAAFTKRGNDRSAVAALWAGALLVLSVQPYILPYWSKMLFGEPIIIAWPWWMVIGGSVSFLVCLTGSRNKERNINTN